MSGSKVTFAVANVRAGARAVIAAILVLTVSPVACFRSPSPGLDETRIACLGDSLTYGSTASGRGQTGGVVARPYPARITESHSPRVAVNHGVGGDTTAQMLGRWRSAVRRTRAGALYLWGGVNDILQSAEPTDVPAVVASIESNLSRIVSEALTDGRRVVLFTIAPWGGVAWPPPSDWNAARQQVTDQVNAWVRRQAGPRVAVCDVWQALNDGNGRLQPAYDSGDGIHLTQAGYDLVAGLAVLADAPRR